MKRLVFAITIIFFTILSSVSFSHAAIERVLALDGREDYVDCGNGESLNLTDALTVEAWVNAKNIISSFSDTGIVVKGNLTYGITRDERSGYNTYVWTYINGGGNHSFSTIELEGWQHIAYTYDKNLDSQQWKLYVNGELKNYRDFSETISISTAKACFKFSQKPKVAGAVARSCEVRSKAKRSNQLTK